MNKSLSENFTAQENDPSKVHVLIVDDQKNIHLLLQKMLTDWGYSTHIAASAESAIESFQQQEFQIVLTDIQLPQKTGLELVAWVKKYFPQSEVIVMTGKASIENTSEALRLSAFDFLLKPFWDFGLIKASIQKASEKIHLQKILVQKASELQKSRESFSNIVEKIDDGLLVIDRDQKIQYANISAYKFFFHKHLLGQVFNSISNIRANLELNYFNPTTGINSFVELRVKPTEWESKPAHLVTFRDITQRKQAERALINSEERYALVMKSSNEGLWDWDQKLNTVYYSPQWKRMLNLQDQTITKSPDEWFSRVHIDDIKGLTNSIKTYLAGTAEYHEHEYRMRQEKGQYRWFLSRAIGLRNNENEVYRLVGSQTDITKRKRAEEKLLHEALHDNLTELPNRILFTDRLERCIKQSLRHKKPFAVLLLDLDRFKNLNDSLGHFFGDRFLLQTAQRVEACLRQGDSIARMGGDEFAILLTDINDASDAIQVAERVQQELAKPFLLNGYEVSSSASIGITLSTMGYKTAEDMIRDTDIAMYRAKADGKARHKIFNHEMRTQAASLLELEIDLRRGIEREEFEVYYQPIISLSENKVTGFEALLRWEHPTRGLIQPINFIPLAEETGLIVPLGLWVIREACNQLKKWKLDDESSAPLTISINLSYRQVIQYDLVDQIKEILAESQLAPKQLKLELTENVLMEHTDLVNKVLTQLKELSIQIDMDDFGTGYSSLSYLHRFPIDTLKIDRSFVSRMEVEEESKEIVRTIISLARNLGMSVVAEGIEQTTQLRKLKDLECNFGQGFLFSKPMTSSDATNYLKQQAYYQ